MLRRGAAGPREEAPFDEDAVPRTRGRRGRGAGAARAKAARRGSPNCGPDRPAGVAEYLTARPERRKIGRLSCGSGI